MIRRKQILDRIIEVVNKSAPDSEIYLFGSHARGNAKKLSDWDVLILLNLENIPFDFEVNFMDELYEIELDTGEIISPLIYSKNDWTDNHLVLPLFENIKKEGVRIQ